MLSDEVVARRRLDPEGRPGLAGGGAAAPRHADTVEKSFEFRAAALDAFPIFLAEILDDIGRAHARGRDDSGEVGPNMQAFHVAAETPRHEQSGFQHRLQQFAFFDRDENALHGPGPPGWFQIDLSSPDNHPTAPAVAQQSWRAGE